MQRARARSIQLLTVHFSLRPEQRPEPSFCAWYRVAGSDAAVNFEVEIALLARNAANCAFTRTCESAFVRLLGSRLMRSPLMLHAISVLTSLRFMWCAATMTGRMVRDFVLVGVGCGIAFAGIDALLGSRKVSFVSLIDLEPSFFLIAVVHNPGACARNRPQAESGRERRRSRFSAVPESSESIARCKLVAACRVADRPCIRSACSSARWTRASACNTKMRSTNARGFPPVVGGSRHESHQSVHVHEASTVCACSHPKLDPTTTLVQFG